MTQSIIDLLGSAQCCKCHVRNGFKRLHSLRNGRFFWLQEIETYCVTCGAVPHLGASLQTDDHAATNELYSLVDNAHGAVAAGTATDAASAGMPDPLQFHELGLITGLNQSALFRNFPTDRATLEPILKEYLRIDDATKTRIVKAPGFHDITVSLDFTVGHVFEPDPDSDRPDRVDANHMLMWPLIERTLERPFEIWAHQPMGRSNDKGWAFLAAYCINGAVFYHEVWVNRKRYVRSSYQLNGRNQANGKRRGIPIYTAY